MVAHQVFPISSLRSILIHILSINATDENLQAKFTCILLQKTGGARKSVGNINFPQVTKHFIHSSIHIHVRTECFYTWTLSSSFFLISTFISDIDRDISLVLTVSCLSCSTDPPEILYVLFQRLSLVMSFDLLHLDSWAESCERSEEEGNWAALHLSLPKECRVSFSPIYLKAIISWDSSLKNGIDSPDDRC